MHGKLTNGYIQYAPSTIEWNGHIVNNPDNAKLLDLGYLPIVYTDMPTNAQQGFHYESEWVQTKTEIKQTWNLVKDEPIPEMPPSLEEEVATLKQANTELATTVDSILIDVLPSMMGV